MIRQCSHVVTTSARAYSLSLKSSCQRDIASVRRLRLRCHSEFIRFSSRTLMKPSALVDRVRIVGLSFVTGSSGSSFLCNAGSYAILYFDGASRGNPGPSGAGACLLESDNNNFFWEGYKWLKNRTNTEAEYEGLILGLEAAREAGIRFLDIYGDSTAVIKQMRGASDVKSSVIVPYYERARELISDIPPPKFRCVAGKENSDADELANAAIDNRNNYSKWFN